MVYDQKSIEILWPLVVVREIAERPGRLTGRDVRLLRLHMKWSARELAEEVGCTVDDIARCEWNEAPLPPEPERSLRRHFLPLSQLWKTVAGPTI
jgi:hypothetical protein